MNKNSYNVDISYLAPHEPSICIPRVFANIDENRIKDIIDKIGLGKIKRIDKLMRTNEKGEAFQRVFIHFHQWFWTETAMEARRRLVAGMDIKIVYDDPWFWKISANRYPVREESYPQQKQPRIEFENYGDCDEFGRNIPRPTQERYYREQDNNRRPDNRRPDNRRPDNRRPDNRRQDNRRPDNRRQDNRRQDNNRRPDNVCQDMRNDIREQEQKIPEEAQPKAKKISPELDLDDIDEDPYPPITYNKDNLIPKRKNNKKAVALQIENKDEALNTEV